MEALVASETFVNFARQSGVTYQNTVIYTSTAAATSNITQSELLHFGLYFMPISVNV
jgi:hypothetical protein